MYDKQRFNKINDKKILHKSHKNWIVVSLSLLSLLGGGALVSTHVNADTLNNNINKNFSNQQQKQSHVITIDTNRVAIGNNNQDVNRDSSSNNVQTATDNKASNIPFESSAAASSESDDITTRANALHNKILYEAEQNYRDESQDLSDVHGAIIANGLHSYINVKGKYDQIFDSVPFDMNNDNTLNRQSVKLSSVPLVPNQDNVIPNNLDINNSPSKDNRVNIPAPISAPLKGNNNNLIGDFANSDGTGGINATLYPNGTFLMSDGVEHTGYFSPATMKIGWPNINGTQSDNSNYAQSVSDTSSDGAPHSKYNDDVVSEQFNNVRVTGDMGDQFADQPNMRFFRISNCDFSDTSDYDGFFAGDNNLQSIQFDNTKGILGGPVPSDSSSNSASDSDSDSDNWDLVDPSDWVDEQTGDTNIKDIKNGDVWINRKNNPITHIFSVPVQAVIQNTDGSTTTKREYATIKGLVNNSTIVNLSQISLDGYTPISTGHASLAFKAGNGVFYYTDNGSSENWINTNNNGQDPTLVVKFKPNINTNLYISSLEADISNDIAKIDGYIDMMDDDGNDAEVRADSSATSTINYDHDDARSMVSTLHLDPNNSSTASTANVDVTSANELLSQANEAKNNADAYNSSNNLNYLDSTDPIPGISTNSMNPYNFCVDGTKAQNLAKMIYQECVYRLHMTRVEASGVIGNAEVEGAMNGKLRQMRNDSTNDNEEGIFQFTGGTLTNYINWCHTYGEIPWTVNSEVKGIFTSMGQTVNNYITRNPQDSSHAAYVFYNMCEDPNQPLNVWLYQQGGLKRENAAEKAYSLSIEKHW